MAQEIAKYGATPQAMISSPALKALRRISLGRVTWEHLPERRYLAGGGKLTAEERQAAETQLAALEKYVAVQPNTDTERLGLIARLLLSYPIAGGSKESGEARAHAYLVALYDVPPAILDSAIARWHRGECGDYNYSFAPAPAILRQVCKSVTEPLLCAADDLRRLLSAMSLDEAMDPKPRETEGRALTMRSL